jgi:hypothetical protein
MHVVYLMKRNNLKIKTDIPEVTYIKLQQSFSHKNTSPIIVTYQSYQ